MGYDAVAGRPLTQLLVRALGERIETRGVRPWPYSPPAHDTGQPSDGIGAREAARSELLLRCLLVGCEQLADIEAALCPDVVVWTPTLHAGDRATALQMLGTDELTRDALSDVMIEVQPADIVGSRAYLEWRLTGRFAHPLFLDDDLLLEPTGRLVEVSGVLVVTFTGDRIAAAHCYYDDLALLEQLVTAS